jgi:hypothetical protein
MEEVVAVGNCKHADNSSVDFVVEEIGVVFFTKDKVGFYKL